MSRYQALSCGWAIQKYWMPNENQWKPCARLVASESKIDRCSVGRTRRRFASVLNSMRPWIPCLPSFVVWIGAKNWDLWREKIVFGFVIFYLCHIFHLESRKRVFISKIFSFHLIIVFFCQKFTIKDLITIELFTKLVSYVWNMVRRYL